MMLYVLMFIKKQDEVFKKTYRLLKYNVKSIFVVENKLNSIVENLLNNGNKFCENIPTLRYFLNTVCM